MDKRMVLAEALSYIIKFSKKTIVIKYGGNAMKDEALQEQVIRDIAFLKYVGINVVLVHGGGPAINDILKRVGKTSEFKHGNRITDDETVELVEMVLGGKVNKNLVHLLNQNKVKAIGVTGKDSQLLKAKKKYLNIDGKKVDIGNVGEVIEINETFIRDMLKMDLLPVIAPLGYGENNETYNINADYVAAEIAIKLKAEKLILMSNIDGIYKDYNDPSSLISHVDIDEAQNLIDTKVVVGGMIPKLESCMDAVERGVGEVHILNGEKVHSVLAELFTSEGIGTMVKGRS